MATDARKRKGRKRGAADSDDAPAIDSQEVGVDVESNAADASDAEVSEALADAGADIAGSIEPDVEETPEMVIDSLKAELHEAVAGRQRAQADFVNFQRRATENERRAREDGETRVLRALLPSLDNLELALLQDPATVEPAQLAAGFKAVGSAMEQALAAMSIEAVRPEAGDDFDPHLHQAVMRQPSDDHDPNTVLNVIQVGYRRGDAVLRPAGVVVAVAPPAPAASDESADGGGDDAGDS